MEKRLLKTGVIVHSLSDVVQMDFKRTNDIMEYYNTIDNVRAEKAYTERIKHSFNGIYEVNLKRSNEHIKFIEMIKSEKCYKLKHFSLWEDWSKNIINDDEYRKMNNELKNCNCEKCSFRYPTIKEWKNNEYIEEDKKNKLNKVLKIKGFSEELISFYNEQEKKDRKVFITISDYPQHIAGKEFYLSSDERKDIGSLYDKCIIGSLYDNRLIVGMLHNSIDDLKNMINNVKAYVTFRLIHVKGIQHLIPSVYNGSDMNIDLLDSGLSKLEELCIHPISIKSIVYDTDVVQWYHEDTNGLYEYKYVDNVMISKDIYTSISVPCPMCMSDGHIDTKYKDNDICVRCPMCVGSKTYNIMIDETITSMCPIINNYKYLYPCNDDDGYKHNKDYITIMVNVSEIERIHVRHGYDVMIE